MLRAAAALLLCTTAGAAGAPGATASSALDELMRDPQKALELVPPELLAEHGGEPAWMSHTAEERTANLQRRLGGEAKYGVRRLQWMWEGDSAQERDASLQAAQLIGETAPSSTCEDSALGGAGPSCVYDCESLRAEYFPGEAARCFLYDPATRSWPPELLGMRRQRLDTYTFASSDDSEGELSFTVGVA